MTLTADLTETQKKIRGLARLGISASSIGDKLTIHSDKPPDDKTIMDAYAEYEAEETAVASVPSDKERIQQLEDLLADLAEEVLFNNEVIE